MIVRTYREALDSVGSHAISFRRFEDARAFLFSRISERDPRFENRLSKCRRCEGLIYWVRTAAGTNAPRDPDGDSHFETCPALVEQRLREARRENR